MSRQRKRLLRCLGLAGGSGEARAGSLYSCESRSGWFSGRLRCSVYDNAPRHPACGLRALAASAFSAAQLIRYTAVCGRRKTVSAGIPTTVLFMVACRVFFSTVTALLGSTSTRSGRFLTHLGISCAVMCCALLPCPVLCFPVLRCPVLQYPVLCVVLPCLILSRPALSSRVLSCAIIPPAYPVFFCFALSSTLLFRCCYTPRQSHRFGFDPTPHGRPR